MNIKDIFDKAEGALTYEQFEAQATKDGAKFFDLSEGNYVSKSKYTDDLAAKDSQITTLNSTISTRDKDLKDLQTKLNKAGDSDTKIQTLTTDLSTLQSKYDTDTENFKQQIAHQAYEFAVKEFAGQQKFTSKAAKRDFINSLVDANLKLNDKNEILGAGDWMKTYSETNEDAFVVDTPAPDPTPTPKPTFVNPTPGPDPDQGGTTFDFGFTGVRAHE